MGVYRLTMVMVVFLVAGLMSCGQQAGKGADTSSVPGKVKETKDFKILVPDGWEFTDFGNAVIQTYNKSGTSMVEVRKAGFNMTDKDLEATQAMLVTQYKGTPLEKVDMLGLTFLKTTYDASSTHQTTYAALLKGGVKLSIGLMGAKHETDPTIQAVLKSIVLK
ncbi:MAG: hypothetical protein IPP94_01945 [Ignavibacteria bacterium]|nr:hypothetical protein [Ignavibacteria bacterium]